jgi:ATP-dependent DNA helicase RecG
VAGYLIGDKQFPKGEKPWRDIHELLNEKEHGRLEFKEALGEDSKRKSPYDCLIKTMVGFANYDGGEVLLGVSDDASVVGVETLIRKERNKDKFELALRNAIRSHIDGAVDKLYRLRFETVEQKDILRIEVEKSNKHIFTNQRGDFYIRDGNATISLSTKEYNNFKTEDD